MVVMDRHIERLIEQHRPRPGTELEPAGSGQLMQLNTNGLIDEALDLQEERDDGLEEGIVITRIVAWEVLAEAQRNGLRLRALRHPGRAGR